MLRLIEPTRPFHPNICPSTGAICLEIYPGESLLEIVESLHDLLRWRLRQYDERDALNKAACAWGRDHVHQPIDDRPLFGRRLQIKLEPVGQQP
jgi:ubiquitin-protein ligase